MASEQREYICIPVLVNPRDSIGFKRSEAIPGVWFKALSTSLKKRIKERGEAPPVKLTFTPTHAIWVDVAKYKTQLRARLLAEGKEEESFKKTKYRDPLDPVPEAIQRQILISLIFHQDCRFSIEGSYSFFSDNNGRTLIDGSPKQAPLRRLSDLMWGALPKRNKPVQAMELRRTAAELDRYYRSGIWWTDEIGMALNSLWECLCTPFPVQAFLSLTTILESILTTEGETTEITHRLAERVAVLLTRNGEERVKIYKQVKELYNIRSKLIHGKAAPKKGLNTTDKLAVTAKRGDVPLMAAEQLADIALKVLKSALRDKDLAGLIRSTQGKDTRRKALSDFFLRLVLAS